MSKRASKPNPLILFTNHMDAWGVTFIIVSIFLLIHRVIYPQTIALMLCVTAGYWFGFAVNDYFDVEVDSDAPDKAQHNFFVHYPISPHNALIVSAVIVFALLLLGFYLFQWRAVILFLIAITVIWAYSAPPLRLKSRAIIDLLTHALFVQTFPYLICVFLVDTPLLPADYLLLAFFSISSLSAQIEQQIRDYEVDKLNDNNFTVTFDKGISLLILKVITVVLVVIISLGVFGQILPLFMLPLVLLGVPLAIHRFIRNDDAPRSELLIKTSAVIGVLYVAGLWVVTLIGFY